MPKRTAEPATGRRRPLPPWLQPFPMGSSPFPEDARGGAAAQDPPAPGSPPSSALSRDPLFQTSTRHPRGAPGGWSPGPMAITLLLPQPADVDFSLPCETTLRGLVTDYMGQNKQQRQNSLETVPLPPPRPHPAKIFNTIENSVSITEYIFKYSGYPLRTHGNFRGPLNMCCPLSLLSDRTP